MAKSPSLELLKGVAKDVEPEADELTIDIDDMSSEELDALVSENCIDTPKGWSGFDAQAKKNWLNGQFASDDAGVYSDVAEPVAKVPAVVETKEDKSPKKKPSKKKDVTIQKEGDDPFFDAVHYIENLSEEDAHAQVRELSSAGDFSFFKLGGVLAKVQDNSWFAPYETFKEYVSQKHGLQYRKAAYCVSIYKALVASGIKWQEVCDLGWTKLIHLAPILNQDNKAEWISLGLNSTVLEIEGAVKAAKNAEIAPSLPSPVTAKTLTFKITEDQREVVREALKKVSHELGHDGNAQALEALCQSYLGFQSLADRLHAAGITKAIEAFEAAFPDAKLSLDCK